MRKLLRVLRSIAAVFAGYVVIVICTTVAFEYMLGGIGYYKSSAGVLAVATGAAIVSGLAGGFVAAWIGGKSHILHGSAVVIPLILDTTYVITSGISHDPVWYDLVGGITLMIAAILGGILKQRISSKQLVLSTS